jgi:hypothetical protein
MSRPAVRPMQSPNQWVLGALSLVVKQPERDADHSLLSSIDSSNELRVQKGCTNPGYQVATATKFCMQAPHISGSSVWNLLHVAF